MVDISKELASWRAPFFLEVCDLDLYRGIALTIAGSDSGGGAGIQADLKTFAALRIFGTSAITAITAQNSLGVSGIHDVPSQMVTAQMDAVLSDFSVAAIKTGMLSREDTIAAVCEGIRKHDISKIVVDPVMVAQSGDSLVSNDAVHALKEQLLPIAFLVTPNIPEAEKLSGLEISDIEGMKMAAKIISESGSQAVLVKGGHMDGPVIIDVLLVNGKYTLFEDRRIETENTHGTGCTLSSAITAELSAGTSLEEAVRRGRTYLRLTLEKSFKPGRGYGPLGHAIAVEWIE